MFVNLDVLLADMGTAQVANTTMSEYAWELPSIKAPESVRRATATAVGASRPI